MNTYQIAPKLVRINLDPQLHEDFARPNKQLQWCPLSTNLDSCEKPPHLFFRITLNDAAEEGNYAGFPTGAPFILQRQAKQEKKTFFLRHWVRKVDPLAHKNLPLNPHPNLQVGLVDKSLVLRVDIDRPLEKAHVFKSIPFATVMFQIVQIDAIIQEIPYVRMAFAIERTLTQSEREQVGDAIPVSIASARKGAGTGSAKNDTTRNKQDKQAVTIAQRPAASSNTSKVSNQVLPTSARPTPLVPQQHANMPYPSALSMPFGSQAIAANRLSSMTHLGAAPMYLQPQYAQGPARHMAVQMRQAVPTRATPPAPVIRTSGRQASAHSTSGHSGTPITTQIEQSGSGRVHGQNRNTNTNKISVGNSRETVGSIEGGVVPMGRVGHVGMMNENTKAGAHPDVRLWQEHDASNPYEPIFITDDKKFLEKTKNVILLDADFADPRASNFDDLFGVRNGNSIELHLEGSLSPDLHDELYNEIEPPLETPFKRTKFESHNTYAAAVVAATEYNSLLRKQREDLRQLLQDADMTEQQSRDDEDTNDAESDSG